MEWKVTQNQAPKFIATCYRLSWSLQSIYMQDWEAAQYVKVFSMQAQKLELELTEPTEEPTSEWVSVVSYREMRGRPLIYREMREHPWKLTGQQAWLTQQKNNQTDPVWCTVESKDWLLKLVSACVHIHTRKCAQIYTCKYLHVSEHHVIYLKDTICIWQLRISKLDGKIKYRIYFFKV